MQFIDTHIHIDGEEFESDRLSVIERAKQAGCTHMLVPAIDLASVGRVMGVCQDYPQFAYPMVGLHPEEVRPDFQQVLDEMEAMLPGNFIAIGEVGLDFYWSREFEQQQLEAFERQVQWSCRTKLPLVIHSRKAQNELVKILQRYKSDLPGGVFHCFTGNLIEARQLLEFDNFFLGIGGVLTFKKSHLPEVLPDIPIQRVLLETDAPYMAPVPKRGTRNESAFIPFVMQRMAECYGITVEEVGQVTSQNAKALFHLP